MVHQPDESCWTKIEMELDFESRLADRYAHLPVYEPDPGVWTKISGQLPEYRGISFSMRLPMRLLAVAASVAVILISTVLFLQIDSGNADQSQLIVNNSLTENDPEQLAMAEIRNQCNLQMPVCERSDFRELMQLYEELKTEELALKSAMKTLGDSPEMIQAMVKIENMKSETLRDLILLIQS